MAANVIVRFRKPFPPYNAGETAGFSPDQAVRLIDQLKVAERVSFRQKTVRKEATRSRGRRTSDASDATE